MRLSSQRHFKRTEYWIVVDGRGAAELDGRHVPLSKGVRLHIPRARIHGMQAHKKNCLLVLELQLGICLEEDIERIEDAFGLV